MPVFAVKCWDIAQLPVHNIGTVIKKGNTEIREYVPKQPPGVLRDESEESTEQNLNIWTAVQSTELAKCFLTYCTIVTEDEESNTRHSLWRLG